MREIILYEVWDYITWYRESWFFVGIFLTEKEAKYFRKAYKKSKLEYFLKTRIKKVKCIKYKNKYYRLSDNIEGIYDD